MSHYREDEQRQKAAVAEDGSLLERATLELRINPPNVCGFGVWLATQGWTPELLRWEVRWLTL